MKEERKKEVGKVGMCELADVKSELMPSQRGCLAERSRCQNLLAVATRPVLSSPRVCGGGMWTQVEKRCPPRGSPDCPAHSRRRSTAPVGGRLSPAQVAASISCRPSNVPGFNVRRQVPAGGRPAGLAELALEDWQDAGKGLPTLAQLGPLCQGGSSITSPTELPGAPPSRL